MPSSDDTDVFNINFTKETLAAIRNEKSSLIEITKKITNEMVGVREQLIKHVFKYNNKNVIHIPVHFLRLIQNIKHQFNIQRDSLVDISPFQLYELLNKTF